MSKIDPDNLRVVFRFDDGEHLPMSYMDFKKAELRQWQALASAGDDAAQQRLNELMARELGAQAIDHGRRTGGKQAAKTRRAEVTKRNESIRKAYANLTQPERDRAAILARRFGLSATQIRRILKTK